MNHPISDSELQFPPFYVNEYIEIENKTSDLVCQRAYLLLKSRSIRLFNTLI